jgi:excinuclease UvrABC ATPase subunit
MSDEPTTSLHPADVERLIAQLDTLVDAGNSVVVVEHDMGVVARNDWMIDIGPGAGDEGGRVVTAGPPEKVAAHDEVGLGLSVQKLRPRLLAKKGPARGRATGRA